MTESLLERSARYIDGATYEGPRTINPIDGSFHDEAPDRAITSEVATMAGGAAVLARRAIELSGAGDIRLNKSGTYNAAPNRGVTCPDTPWEAVSQPSPQPD